LPSKGLIIILGIFLFISSVEAGTYLPIEEDVYNILLRLEAEGVINSSLLTTRPLSYREIVRLIFEAEDNSKDKSPFIQGLVSSLKERFRHEGSQVRYIKPLDALYARYVYADSDSQVLYYNMEGDYYKKGSNGRIGVVSRSDLRWLSFYLAPEFRYYEQNNEVLFKRLYGVLSFSGLELTVGKDSQWWGPGYHGAILLSNNAEPFTMLRLTNPQPALLPWIFKYLGPFRFTFFVTRLEEERLIPEPYLWGMRLNFKPLPSVEIGLSRTALLGGKGRSEDLRTWWRSFTGKGENEKDLQAGDQRAGGDIKFTIPFRIQPIQLYIEAQGEDEAGGLPYKWAYLTGIYLPRLLTFERLGFRAEYATTHVKGEPNIWYSHGIYGQAAYTYKGRVIGHHMGTDSEDLFFELSYLIPEKDGRLYILYDIERHNLSGASKERKKEVSLMVDFKLTKGLYFSGLYGFGRIEGSEYGRINIFRGIITTRF